MRALSDPATHSTNPIDKMVEQFSSERRVHPSICIKSGSVINASNWKIEEKNRICWNRRRNKLVKVENLTSAIMSGSTSSQGTIGLELFSPLKKLESIA